MTQTTEPFVAHVGEPTRFPLAGFIDADFPGLPPEQAQMLRSLEAAERQEQREHEEHLAARRELAENMALGEAARRAHAHGEAWDPSNPLKHYPTREQRVAEAFALKDVMAASELREARREAAAVLRRHGIAAQVLVDADATELPHPGPAAGATPPPASRSHTAASGPEVAARATPLGAKVRAAFTRWASPKRGHGSGSSGSGSSGCGCAAVFRAPSAPTTAPDRSTPATP